MWCRSAHAGSRRVERQWDHIIHLFSVHLCCRSKLYCKFQLLIQRPASFTRRHYIRIKMHFLLTSSPTHAILRYHDLGPCTCGSTCGSDRNLPGRKTEDGSQACLLVLARTTAQLNNQLLHAECRSHTHSFCAYKED